MAVSFLEFALWVIGGSIALTISLSIIAAAVLQIRKDFLINERRFRRDE